MTPEERRRRVAGIIRDAGNVTVSTLEAEFEISAATARRDLDVLEKVGQARRTHGGAVFPGTAGHEDSFEERLNEAVEAKMRLAGAASAIVEPGSTIFVDSSTTAYYATQRVLADISRATFLSNLLPAMELFKTLDTPGRDFIGIGGAFKELTKSFVGPHAVRMVRAHFTDLVFVSVKGITPEGEMTDPDPSEAEVKRAMIERSKTPVLLIDGRKFKRRGLSLISDVSSIGLVLAADCAEPDLRALERKGVEVRRV
ncbi:MAG: DeoR/GlpR family DNA-binding transcription regulator [Rubrobacteraceae bacterium]